MAEWHIEQLDPTHVRADFSCGNSTLDTFLHSLVSQYEKRRLGRTYVAVRSGERRVLGYYTLASGAVSFENLPPRAGRKLPRHPISVVLLARLAVDGTVRGQGLGGLLLADALRRCVALAEQLGIHAVAVDAIDESARTFYERHGFVPLEDNPLHMYLPISTIEDSQRDTEPGTPR
jgi:GNAT superfamily N-acetyltransferase